MTQGRFWAASLAGGVTLFVAGFLLWGLVFAGFYEAHVGSATERDRGEDQHTLGKEAVLLGERPTRKRIVGDEQVVVDRGEAHKIGVDPTDCDPRDG